MAAPTEMSGRDIVTNKRPDFMELLAAAIILMWSAPIWYILVYFSWGMRVDPPKCTQISRKLTSNGYNSCKPFQHEVDASTMRPDHLEYGQQHCIRSRTSQLTSFSNLRHPYEWLDFLERH